MLELADIVRAVGEAYQRLRGATLRPAQRRVLDDIVACRTAALGGHVQACDHCGARQYSYHSCRNRHCPKCHGEQTERWLDRQRARLLPCAYYLVTFTLPDALRALARAQPKVVYGVLMRAAAAALLTLTADPRYLGGRPGVLAVLHTWTRALLYHPHVHMLVTAGGLRGADQIWVAPRHAAFLVPGRALSRLFRGKVRAALRTAGVLEQVPATLWRHEWVVHVQPAGTGEKVLEYLARYVFRIALVNSRLERFEDGQITFRYREGRTGLLRRCTLDAVAFLDRFLQHVLPPGFTKVRHYGLFSPSRRELLARARAQLLATSATPSPDSAPADPVPISAPASAPLPRCPVCAVGLLHVVEILPRAGARHEPPARHSPRGRFGAPRGAGRGGLSDRRAGRSPPASARRSPPCSTPAVAGREPLTPLRLPLPGSSNGLESPKRAASGQIEFNTAFCLGVARQKALNR